VITENIVALITVLLICFPILYIFYKNGTRKFLYILSVYGGAIVIYVLLYITLIPANLMYIYIIPELQARSLDIYLWSLIQVFDLVSTYYMLIASVIYIWLSFTIYKKYSFFKEHT